MEDLQDKDETVQAGRRQFLKDAGKYAAYTPPAVMLLMKPAYSSINKSMTGRPNVVVGQDVPPSGDPRRFVR